MPLPESHKWGMTAQVGLTYSPDNKGLTSVKGVAGVGPGALREIIKTMKFEKWTIPEETIWAVEDTEAAARTEGEATMRDNDASGQLVGP